MYSRVISIYLNASHAPSFPREAHLTVYHDWSNQRWPQTSPLHIAPHCTESLLDTLHDCSNILRTKAWNFYNHSSEDHSNVINTYIKNSSNCIPCHWHCNMTSMCHHIVMPLMRILIKCASQPVLAHYIEIRKVSSGILACYIQIF